MIHVKFQDHRTAGKKKRIFKVKVFIIYWFGGYLSHVTWSNHTLSFTLPKEGLHEICL